MTFLEILGYARKGLNAEKQQYIEMREKADKSQLRGAEELKKHLDEDIKTTDAKLRTIDEFEALHNRR